MSVEPDGETKPKKSEPAPEAESESAGGEEGKGKRKGKLQALFAEYGAIAVGTYLSIFALTLAGFSAAIGFGFEVEGMAAGAGTFGAAYLATKLTQPLRIGATLLMTPVVAGVWHRFRGKPRDDAA